MELLIACFDDDLKADALRFSWMQAAKDQPELFPHNMDQSVVFVREASGKLKFQTWSYALPYPDTLEISLPAFVAKTISQHPAIDIDFTVEQQAEAVSNHSTIETSKNYTVDMRKADLISSMNMTRELTDKKAAAMGIHFDFVRRFSDRLKPGNSALLTVVEAKVADDLHEFDTICTEVFRTTINYDKEKLVALVESHTKAWADRLAEKVRQKGIS